MLTRRHLLAAATLLPVAAHAQGAPGPQGRFDTGSFDAFLAGLSAEARRDGIGAATLERALGGLRPNPHVLELDRHQPEFTLTWAQYRARVIPDSRIAKGRDTYAQVAGTTQAVTERLRVTPDGQMGIWGIESSFGANRGSFSLVQALATLAWDGRRASYFRKELINALHILDHGDVTTEAATSGWAGAMGQPQFMPSSYLRYAVDFDGDGRRDIWNSVPDVLGSIANYLGKSGWRYGEPVCQPVRVPAGFDATLAGREKSRALGEWMQTGVRRDDGTPFSRGDVAGALLLPDGIGGEAFMVYPNFNVIRRYNPSDFYALAVGLLGAAVVT